MSLLVHVLLGMYSAFTGGGSTRLLPGGPTSDHANHNPLDVRGDSSAAVQQATDAAMAPTDFFSDSNGEYYNYYYSAAAGAEAVVHQLHLQLQQQQQQQQVHSQTLSPTPSRPHPLAHTLSPTPSRPQQQDLAIGLLIDSIDSLDSLDLMIGLSPLLEPPYRLQQDAAYFTWDSLYCTVLAVASTIAASIVVLLVSTTPAEGGRGEGGWEGRGCVGGERVCVCVCGCGCESVGARVCASVCMYVRLILAPPSSL
jgi:hypothetical protein